MSNGRTKIRWRIIFIGEDRRGTYGTAVYGTTYVLHTVCSKGILEHVATLYTCTTVLYPTGSKLLGTVHTLR